MKITEKLKVTLKSLLSIKMGETVTDKAILIYDNEGIVEGIEVFVKGEGDEIIPAEDGEYTTEDNKVIVVDGGIIKEIREIVEETPVEEVTEFEETEVTEEEVEPADTTEEEEKTEEPADNRLAEVENKLAEIANGLSEIINSIASLEGRIGEVETKVAKVETEPAADPVEETEVEETPKSRMSYLRKK